MNNQKFKEEFKLLLEKTIFPSDIKDEERSKDWNNIISYIIANVPSNFIDLGRIMIIVLIL